MGCFRGQFYRGLQGNKNRLFEVFWRKKGMGFQKVSKIRFACKNIGIAELFVVTWVEINCRFSSFCRSLQRFLGTYKHTDR